MKYVKTVGGNSPRCPVCDSLLIDGNSVKSKVFGREDKSKSDFLCYVYGCNMCYPKAKGGLKRSCPICHKEVKAEGYLLARMFNIVKVDEQGKRVPPHVIINGCGQCNRSRC